MIGHVTVGADDLHRAERFYSAFLPSLGYTLDRSHDGLSSCLPATTGRPHPTADFYVKPPFNGQTASVGNGTMVAFQATSQAQVRDLHAAALTAGGHDEGAPGFRALCSAEFYVAYLGEPQGNKIALYSNDPGAPARPD